MDKNILISTINKSITELANWKINRDRANVRRQKQNGESRPLTSDTLTRTIETLTNCKEYIINNTIL